MSGFVVGNKLHKKVHLGEFRERTIMEIQLNYNGVIHVLGLCVTIAIAVGIFIFCMNILRHFQERLPEVIFRVLVGICILISLLPLIPFDRLIMNNLPLSKLDASISVDGDMVTIENDKFYYSLGMKAPEFETASRLGDRFIGRYEYDASYDAGYLVDKNGTKYSLSRVDNEYINKKVRGDI